MTLAMTPPSSRWPPRLLTLLAGLLLLAGVYQLSPLKNACLSKCRAPAAFLSAHWRPGAAGALRRWIEPLGWAATALVALLAGWLVWRAKFA